MRFVCRICVEYRHRWTGRYEAHLWDKSTWNQNQNKKGKQGSSSSFFFLSASDKIAVVICNKFSLVWSIKADLFCFLYIFMGDGISPHQFI